MMKHVTLTIRTCHSAENARTELSRRESGTLEPTQNGFLLRYTETDENALATENEFLLQPDRGLLRRSGTVNSEMSFSPGTDTDFSYRTFYGTFPLSLHTDYFRHSLTEKGGSVMIRYTLLTRGQLLGKYTLKLHITEKDD